MSTRRNYLEMAMNDSGLRFPSTNSPVVRADEQAMEQQLRNTSQRVAMQRLRDTETELEAELLWRNAVHGFAFHGGDTSTQLVAAEYTAELQAQAAQETKFMAEHEMRIRMQARKMRDSGRSEHLESYAAARRKEERARCDAADRMRSGGSGMGKGSGRGNGRGNGRGKGKGNGAAAAGKRTAGNALGAWDDDATIAGDMGGVDDAHITDNACDPRATGNAAAPEARSEETGSLTATLYEACEADRDGVARIDQRQVWKQPSPLSATRLPAQTQAHILQRPLATEAEPSAQDSGPAHAARGRRRSTAAKAHPGCPLSQVNVPPQPDGTPTMSMPAHHIVASAMDEHFRCHYVVPRGNHYVVPRGNACAPGALSRGTAGLKPLAPQQQADPGSVVLKSSARAYSQTKQQQQQTGKKRLPAINAHQTTATRSARGTMSGYNPYTNVTTSPFARCADIIGRYEHRKGEPHQYHAKPEQESQNRSHRRRKAKRRPQKVSSLLPDIHTGRLAGLGGA